MSSYGTTFVLYSETREGLLKFSKLGSDKIRCDLAKRRQGGPRLLPESLAPYPPEQW